MTKSKAGKLTRILSVFMITMLIAGCRYYKRKPINWNPPSSYVEHSAYASASGNNYILHLGDRTIKLTKVVINKKEKTISGWSAPFEGLEKKYYDKASPRGIRTRRKSWEDKAAIRQVHLHASVYSSEQNEQYITVKFEDVTKVEVLKSAHGLNFIVSAVTIGAAAGLTVGLFLAIACNCPHVYIHNGQAYELNTSLFTGAIAPQLERHDYKLLPDYFKDSANYSIKVVNEENENQYTSLLELMAVYHAENTQVIPDKNGCLHTITKPVAPVKAMDNGSRNILSKISTADNEPYNFNSDSTKELCAAMLTFNKPEQALHGKLVLRVRNSSWSGLVYDRFNALFGKRHDEWVKRNKNKPREERVKWMKEQGINLLVDIKTAEGWKTTDLVELVGEISYNSVVIPLSLPSGETVVEVRLRSGFMFWELDQAAMDFSEDLPLDIQRLQPVTASGDKGEDFMPALKADDDSYMAHLGDSSSTSITFAPIKISDGKVRTIILHSKGYYIYNRRYSGRVHKRELAAFRNPGELSRFSKQLYERAKGDLVIIE